MSSPLRLSDAQMDAIFAASHPLPPDRRSLFLAEVATAITGLPEVGDGALHRLITEVQRRHFDPPEFGTGEARRAGGKYW